jgi:hypothetical protein
MRNYLLKQFSVLNSLMGLVLFWLVLFLWANGCSVTDTVTDTVKDTTKKITKTTKKLARDITFAGDGLKKVVTVVGFENKSLQGTTDFQNKFHKDLIEHLNSKCEDLIVVDSGSDAQPGRLTQLPKLASGQTDNFALAVIGRQLGVNAIIAGSLSNLRPTDEVEGILWMKDTQYMIEVLIRTEVYDTQTATKILDESFVHELEIDEVQYKEIQTKKTYDAAQLNEAYAQIVLDMGDRICEMVGIQLWHGYVTAIDGDKIIISGGSLVGLKPGNKLEVFDSGRILEGIDGQRFIIPRFKTAELEIVAISDNQAETAKVSGRGLKEGSIVRKK